MTNSQTTRDFVAGEVRAGLARKGKTQAWLAEEIGISRPTLSSRLQGESAFNTDELLAISSALTIAFASLWPTSEFAG